ncbi:hypothetical protein G4B84_008827, partial [Aspergillus flavus NRRL3357]
TWFAQAWPSRRSSLVCCQKNTSATDSFNVSFDEFWHLFTPGETIYYSEAKSNPGGLDYDKLRKSRRPDERLWWVYTRYEAKKQFWVKAYCIDYDSTSYVCVKEWFFIERYEERVSVTSLKVYQIRFSRNVKRVMEDENEVGRGFMQTRDSKLLAHTGWAFVPEQNETNFVFVSGNVVIDFEEPFKAHPDFKPVRKLPSTRYHRGLFLRVLDYYSGILFFTTNRVGTMDEAFKFRIYIRLYYPYLDLDQSEKIWEVRLDRLATIREEHGGGRKPLSIDREGILAFAKKHLTKSENGKGRTRGIKNGGNPCDLNGRHLKTVVKAGTGFEKYLLETRGMTDQEAAYLNSTRADDLQSQKAVNASRAAAPASAQPAKPLAYPGWVNQYPSQPSFVPPQAQAAYKLATSPSPANRLYPQQLQQPHYVFPGPSLQNTYGQPLIAEGYHQPQALTPVPQVQLMNRFRF